MLTLGANSGDGGILAKGTYNSGTAIGTPGAGTRMVWNPKKAAFRAGYVEGTQWNDASIGAYSFAVGYDSTASGYASVASGSYSTASGSYSTASGSYSAASGVGSAASGYGSTASGDYSSASGYVSTAKAFYDFAIGTYNVGAGTTTSRVATDPVFEVGNGQNAPNTLNNNNAFTILKNGNVGINNAFPTNPLAVTPLQYLTGTASQSAYTVTGVGTTWTSAMIGSRFIFANGAMGNITAVGSTTSLTLDTSQTVSSSTNYWIDYTGLQVTATGAVGINTLTPSAMLHVKTGSILAGTGTATGTVGGTTMTGNIVADVDTGNPTQVEMGLRRADNATAGQGAVFFVGRERGTIASPTTVATGDTLSTVYGFGYDGTNDVPASAIITTATGTVGTGYVPGILALQTANSSGTLTNALTINSAQNITLGSVGALRLPVGTTTQEPSSPVVGMIRYNSTVPQYEGYINSAWSPLGGASSVSLGTSVTAASPSISGDATTGLYSDAAATVKVAISGGNKAIFDATGLTVGSYYYTDGIAVKSYTAQYGGGLNNQTLAVDSTPALVYSGASGGDLFVGHEAGVHVTTGGANTVVGQNALHSNVSSDGNTSVGFASLSLATGSHNNAFGRTSCNHVTTGSYNLCLGEVGTGTLTTGSGNILINGDNGSVGVVDTPTSSTSNFLNIGNTLFATGVGTGSVAAPAGSVGILTTAPAAALHDAGGKFLVTGGTAPVINSCGTASAVTGADSSFNLTVGTGATTSCSISFGTAWTTAPAVCTLQPTNAAAAAQATTGAYVSAISTTTLTLTGIALANATYGVHCY